MISKTPNQRHIHDSLQRAARDRAWKLKAAELEIETARREGLASGREEGRATGRKEGLEIGREEGLEIGREEGLEKGVQIGQIRILELLLNVQPTAELALSNLTLPELNERVSSLKEQLNLRGNS